MLWDLRWSPTLPCHQAIGPLRENLEHVTPRLIHHVKHLVDERHGDAVVEKVAHTIDEDPPRLTPRQREPKLIRVQRQREAGHIPRISHSLQPTREALRVAELAPRRDFRATGYGVPSRICPLNRRDRTHSLPS